MSFVELCNLAMRLQMRRFTHLSEALLERPKPETRGRASLYAQQQALHVTPAKEARISNQVCSIEEILR
jgi:hypothetical protein